MSKPIDKVTTDLLDRTLRMCGIQINEKILDRVIDVVELLEDKGDQTRLSDIEKLKAEWGKQK